MDASLSSLTLPALCLVIGFAVNRILASTQTLNRILVNYVIYIVMPCIIFLKIPQLSLSTIPWFLPLLAWFQVLLAAMCVLICAQIFNWPRQLTGAMLLIAPLGNTSFLGFPATTFFFGENALTQAIIYDQFGMFIALSLYGTLILSMYAPNTTSPSAKKIIWNIVKFPPFLAMMIALAFISPSHITKYETLHTSMQLCADSLLPVIMFIIGLYLQFDLPKHDRLPLALGLFIKMIIVPLSSIIIGSQLDIEKVTYIVSIFEAAMPPMMTAGILAIQANLKPQLSAAMISLGLLFALIYLPLVAMLIAQLHPLPT